MEYNEETYGELIADIYDHLYGGVDPGMIECLAEFSKGGAALELGIGTGRVAIPLKEKGVLVSGIDASRSMVEKMRQKTVDNIPVTIASFADFGTESRYDLVYVVFNTIFSLLTQTDQISCFQSVKKALKPGGHFVIEAFIPDLNRFDRGQSVRTTDINLDGVTMENSMIDMATQRITAQITRLNPEGIQFYPVQIRYAWPSEFDLLAKLAGLSLASRWNDWDKSAFNRFSNSHISVYQNNL